MAVDTYALTTLSNVKAWLGIPTATTTHDTLLEMLINQASVAIETFCGRQFVARSYTEYHSGHGLTYIYVDHPPINSITSIYDDIDRAFGSETVVCTTYYTTDGKYADEGRIQLWQGKSNFGAGIMNVKVTYNGGWATVPKDIQEACQIFVDLAFNGRTKGAFKSERIDDYSYTLADQMGSKGIVEHPMVMGLIGPYRLFRV